MYVGIILAIIGASIYFYHMIRDIIWDKGNFTLALALLTLFMFPGMFLVMFAFNPPSCVDASNSVSVNGENILFKDYQLKDNNLIIPTHYYKEESWVNTWEYCGSPITVVMPNGYNLTINNRTSDTESQKPYIIGGCK